MKDTGLFEYMYDKFGFFKDDIFNTKSDNLKYLQLAEKELLNNVKDVKVLNIYKSELEKHFDYILEDYLKKTLYFGIQVAMEITNNIELLEDTED